MNTKFLLLISITAFIFCSCSVKTELKQQVSDLLRPEIILRGDDALGEEPVTITSFVAERSAGEFMIFILKAITGGRIR